MQTGELFGGGEQSVHTTTVHWGCIGTMLLEEMQKISAS